MGDAVVISRLRRGEAAAFDAAYAQYRARLYSFLVRLTRNRDLAQDLLQETWLRLARHATRLDEDTQLSAWLFTVARNLWLSHRRWNLIDADRLRALGLMSDNPKASPFDSVCASETERRVEAAVAALRPAYREVILLVAVESFSPAEAAQILGLRPDALRQRLSRARATLASKLGEASQVGVEGVPT